MTAGGEKRYAEARELLLGLIEAVRHEAQMKGWPEAPWYKNQLGIVELAIDRERKRAETEAGKGTP